MEKLKITGNEPAYPLSVCVDENGIYDTSSANGGEKLCGLTIRQELASRNLQGLISKYNLKSPEDQQIVCQLSVELADALITELNKTP